MLSSSCYVYQNVVFIFIICIKPYNEFEIHFSKIYTDNNFIIIYIHSYFLRLFSQDKELASCCLYWQCHTIEDYTRAFPAKKAIIKLSEM